MKILQPGRKPNWWVGREATCVICGAIVQFEESDKIDPNEPDLGLKTIYAKCPECNGPYTTIRLTAE